MPNKKISVLTGAGISAESGLSTFRDSGGLWEGFNVSEVASIQGWYENPKKVLDFYNLRRKQAIEAKPNHAHLSLKLLEEYFEVVIITQNVDDLHERAASKKVIHLHGELNKARSEVNSEEVIEIGSNEIHLGDTSLDGSQLRPAIVWFGEMVPLIKTAEEQIATSDIVIVIGTSLAVYPAAGLTEYCKEGIPKYIVDPHLPEQRLDSDWIHIQESATLGVPELVKKLISQN